ncbi:MAG: hypothetical protein WED33_08740 [Bacteroidia bacterium]
MPLSLYQRLFVSAKLILGFIFLSFSLIHGQGAYLNVSAPSLTGESIRVNHPKGIILQVSETSFSKIDSSGNLIIHVYPETYEIIQLAYGDAFLDVILQNGDSVEVFWNKENKTWDYQRSSPLNTQADSLNSQVNAWLMKLAYSRNSAESNAFIQIKLDSLKTTGLKNPDDFLSIYQFYAAADLDFMLGKSSFKDLSSFYFKNHTPKPFHPAWQYSFHSYYEGDVLKRLNQANSLELETALKKANWNEIEQTFMKDTSVSDTTFLPWLILKGVYDLSFTSKYPLQEFYRILENGLISNAGNSDISEEIDRILKRWYPRIQGNEFPDFELFSISRRKALKLSELTKKPIYLVSLPDREANSLLLLKQVLSLQKKYGSEIHFVAIIPSLEKEQYEVFENYYGAIELIDFDSCKEEILSLFSEADQPNFALIDKGFRTYLMPAEAPETGVENSFLGLIKK